MSIEKKHILLAEDDKNLGTILSSYLKVKGFDVTLCPDGVAAFDAFNSQPFDFCIVDVMMPLKDGFTLAQEIRAVNPLVPILFLTARSRQEDVLEGFHSGADDYLTKPFGMEELLARMQAIMRRAAATPEASGSSEYRIGGYVFEPVKQTLSFGGESQRLTSKENDLLMLLARHRNEVLDRSIALKAIWKDDSYFNARSMDVYITKLRKYLRDDPRIEIINVHGVGFKLIAP
jgi:two-component system, OmpR family, response regulator